MDRSASCAMLVSLCSIMSSRFEPFHFRVVQAARSTLRMIARTERFDFECLRRGDLGGEIGEGNRPPERVAVIGTGGEAHETVAKEHRLAAVEGREGFDGQGTELAHDAALADFLKGITADEVALAESNGETEARLIGIVVRGYDAGTIEKALLH